MILKILTLHHIGLTGPSCRQLGWQSEHSVACHPQMEVRCALSSRIICFLITSGVMEEGCCDTGLGCLKSAI